MKKYKNGDYITFIHMGKTYKYKINGSYLEYPPTGHNHTILTILYGKNYRNVVEEEYGYESRGGMFPECKPGDINALNRIINRIKRDCISSFVQLLSTSDGGNEHE